MSGIHCNIDAFLLLLGFLSSFLVVEFINSLTIFKQHRRRKFYEKVTSELEQLEREATSIDKEIDDITL